MRNNILLRIVVPVALALVVGGAFVYLFFFAPAGTKLDSPQNDPLFADATVLPKREGAVTELSPTMARYWNDRYFFTLDYPKELTLTEVDENGATTVVFQKPDEKVGFQMFIVRYRDEVITEERLGKDLKGAPMNNPTEIVLPGNIRALHFTSESPSIGPSVEVWFIHKGYLYEVTAYAELDSWLAGILSTLTFEQ